MKLYINTIFKKILKNYLPVGTLQCVESLKYLNRRVYSSIENNNYGNRIIYENLNLGPCAVGRFGSVENSAIRKYCEFKNHKKIEEITSSNRFELYNNAGLHPNNMDTYSKYCSLMLHKILPEMNVISVWFNYGEYSLLRKYSTKSDHVSLQSLESYFCDKKHRWTRFLEGKKVLVISPFEKSINYQYSRRELIWGDDDNILPRFTLLTLKVPHQPSIETPWHESWFETLEYLKSKMDLIDFDIALVGAGAYSLPLVVHAKNLKKRGVHLGGALQIYFGIYGSRWENNEKISYFKNRAWIRPFSEETPIQNKKVENGCYW
jgi:hypothetical protein